METFIRDLKANKNIYLFDEEATKQAIILRLLNLLGWNPYNIEEVKPQYGILGKKCDYALRINSTTKIFLEVKKIGEDLERHQEQLLDYAFKEGVKLAVLTNGISWWFYLPLREGSWAQRRFLAINLLENEEKESLSNLHNYLSRANVASGKAVTDAQNHLKERLKIKSIEDALPRIWAKFLNEPPLQLLNLVNSEIEKTIGSKADDPLILRFIKSLTKTKETPTLPQKSRPKPLPDDSKVDFHVSSDRFTGKKPISFEFLGAAYPIHSWQELLLTLCHLLQEKHSSQFDVMLNLTGKKRPYFSEDPKLLRFPKKINNTRIFVETNLSAENIYAVCKRMLNLLGYAEDLRIKTYKR